MSDKQEIQSADELAHKIDCLTNRTDINLPILKVTKWIDARDAAIRAEEAGKWEGIKLERDALECGLKAAEHEIEKLGDVIEKLIDDRA